MSQRFDLGVHYTLRREYDRAVHAFEEVVRDEPTNPRAWSHLGIAFAHLGKGPEAERALARAIELGPGNPEAWFHLGVARSLRGEWPDAVSAYRHAVALTPEDLVAWHRLGVALAESGDEPAASAAFERALVLSRETGGPELEEAAGDPTRDPHTQEATEPEGRPEVEGWLDLALQLLSLGDEEEAVAAYERAYTIDPDRARTSLFRPMLQLVTAASGRPIDDLGPSTGPEPPSPPQPMRPRRSLEAEHRPEVG